MTALDLQAKVTALITAGPMDHLWSNFLPILILVAGLASSDQEVLIEKPECDSCSWNWTILQTAEPGYTGWYEKGSPPEYLACINNFNASTSRPNSWLRSDKITVNEAKRLDVTVRYFIADCSSMGKKGENKCVNAIDLYVKQSNHDIIDKSNYPNPLSHTTSYEKIAELGHPTKVKTSKTVPVVMKGKFLFLAFHNNGACSILYSVKVSYNFCPEKTLSNNLLVLPRTAAPANVLEISRVEGRCKENAVQLVSSLHAYCDSRGSWNKTSFEGRCICKEDMENTDGRCQACPNGKYNDEKGFNCTSLPSAPRNTTVAFVNQSVVEITWLLPAETGDHTLVSYDVECLIRKVCINSACLYEPCGDDVAYRPKKQGLEMTHVTLEGLSSKVNYTLRIYARNRVSEVAKRRYGVEGKFEAISVRMKESVAPSMKGLNTEDSKAVIYLNIIYGFVVLFALFIVGSVCFIIYKRCRHQRNRDRFEEPETAEPTGTMSLEAGKAESTGAMRVEPEKAESLMSAYDNVALWTVAEGQNEDGIRLIRDQIKTIRFLGNGNFGQVYHAVYGPLRTEVAVKSLRDDATKKDLKDILTELDLMKSLKPHPHVVRLIGCCTEKDPIMIVLEYLPYGDLLGYLRKSRGIEDTYNSGEKRPSSTLTEKDLLSFAWMIADGMSYLSTMKVVHRDLAARNVLVGDNKVCKISDFGLARGLEGDVYMRKAKARLPIKWMPPESLLYGTSTTMSDIWSYGIVMWEVFTIGESPYPGKTKSEIAGLLVKGYRMPKPAHISKELYSIMTKCWEEKPQERPTFQWLCSAVKKLLHDRKNHVNLEVYDTKDYVNFDMMAGKDHEEKTATDHND